MTVKTAVEAASARLLAAGIDNPRREARLLLNLALGLAANALLPPDRLLSESVSAVFAALVARRVLHEPYSRIAGRREFWSRDFLLSPDTLDPRPDSETVIEAALARIPDRTVALNVIDFGTGTGALLLALLAELPNARGLGIDIAPGAVETARRNAAMLGLDARARFARGNWGQDVVEQADVILANPPYILPAELASLAPEIKLFDPLRALDGGVDGLAAYRQLAPDLKRLLGKSGFAVCEIGLGQGRAVAEIMRAVGLEFVTNQYDLAGIERCLVFGRREKLR